MHGPDHHHFNNDGNANAVHNARTLAALPVSALPAKAIGAPGGSQPVTPWLVRLKRISIYPNGLGYYGLSQVGLS